MGEKLYYIYSHSDKNGVVRYIGQGKRLPEHKTFVRAYTFNKARRTREWSAVFNSSDKKPRVDILETELDEVEVNKRERHWIDFHKLVKEGGTLVNIVTNLSFLTQKEKNHYYSSKITPEERRRYKREWKKRQETKELIRKYYDKQNEKRKNETTEEREKRLLYHKEYKKRNKEKMVRYQMKYREKKENREKYLAYMREYNKRKKLEC